MTIAEMTDALRAAAPASMLKVKESQGTKIAYLPWYSAAALADQRLGGAWSHELVEHWIDDAKRGSTSKGYTDTALAHCRVRVTLHGSDRDVSREAVGVDDEPTGQRGTPLERAEAAGLRRALAKFGLGLHLYGGGVSDEQTGTQAPRHSRTEAQGAPRARQEPPRQPAPAPAAKAADPRFTDRIAAATTSAQVDALLAEIAGLDNPHHRENAVKLANARMVALAAPRIGQASGSQLAQMRAKLDGLPMDTPGLSDALDQIFVREAQLVTGARVAAVSA